MTDVEARMLGLLLSFVFGLLLGVLIRWARSAYRAKQKELGPDQVIPMPEQRMMKLRPEKN